MRRQLLIITTALSLVGSYPVFAADMSSDIVGTYLCKGNDPTLSPSTYTGKYTISIQGQQYIMGEKVHDGAKSIVFNQFALRHGNVLTIAFQRSDASKVFGTEYMHITAHGDRLTGTFSYWGEPNKLGTETCQRAK